MKIAHTFFLLDCSSSLLLISCLPPPPPSLSEPYGSGLAVGERSLRPASRSSAFCRMALVLSFDHSYRPSISKPSGSRGLSWDGGA